MSSGSSSIEKFRIPKALIHVLDTSLSKNTTWYITCGLRINDKKGLKSYYIFSSGTHYVIFKYGWRTLKMIKGEKDIVFNSRSLAEKLRARACSSKVSKLFEPISGATIPSISSQRRGSKPSNFAILLVFLTLKAC